MEITKHQKHQIAPILQAISDTAPEVAAATMFKYVAKNTPALDAFTADHENYPTINSLRCKVGDDAVFMLVVMFIEDCVRSLAVNQPTKDQVLEMAREIMADYPTYKAEDFKTFFTNVKKGKYGKDYNRFDLATVYQMLATYNDERTDAFERAIANRTAQANSTIRTPSDTKSIHALYDQVVYEQLTKEKKKEYDRARQRAITNWMNDYQIHFAGQTVTPEADAEYRKARPLDEDYIANYIANDSH